MTNRLADRIKQFNRILVYWIMACSITGTMILTVSFVLVLLALVCLALAAMNVSVRINLVAAGLFLWLLSTVVR
jgi:hypothetical protein